MSFTFPAQIEDPSLGFTENSRYEPTSTSPRHGLATWMSLSTSVFTNHLFQSCLLSPLALLSLSIIFTYCICHCCPTLSCGVALDFMSSSLTCRRRCSLAPAWTNSNPHTPSILRKQAATSFPDQPDKLKKAFLALAVSHFVFRPMVLIHLESEGNLRTVHFVSNTHILVLETNQLAIL